MLNQTSTYYCTLWNMVESKSEFMQQYNFVNDKIEMFTVQLKLTKYLIFSVVYRPESKYVAVEEFTHALHNIFDRNLFSRNNAVLLGNFSINLLKRTSHQPTHSFLNTMQSLNYFPNMYLTLPDSLAFFFRYLSDHPSPSIWPAPNYPYYNFNVRPINQT